MVDISRASTYTDFVFGDGRWPRVSQRILGRKTEGIDAVSKAKGCPRAIATGLEVDDLRCDALVEFKCAG